MKEGGEIEWRSSIKSRYSCYDSYCNTIINNNNDILAHRLSTIRNADRIAVVNEVRIVELGTHDDLVALGGLYADLVSLQMHALQEVLDLIKSY